MSSKCQNQLQNFMQSLVYRMETNRVKNEKCNRKEIFELVHRFMCEYVNVSEHTRKGIKKIKLKTTNTFRMYNNDRNI